MNLRDLQYVLRVAELGHFGRAAEACNVSQPTLSGQILKLEQELGVAIFERSGRQVRVTRAGQRIVAEARRISDSARTIGLIAAASRDPMIGMLRLGLIPTVAPYLTPALLPRVAAALPQAPLTIVEDVTDALVPRVFEADLDAAVVASDPGDERIETVALFSEQLYLLMPADHALAKRRTIDPKAIDPKSLLLLNEGHCLRDQTIDLCGHPDLGRAAMADTRATSMETLLHLTAAGHGVTIVPALSLQRWSGLMDRRLAARPLTGGQRHVQLAFRRDPPRRPAIARLASVLRDCAPAKSATKAR